MDGSFKMTVNFQNTSFRYLSLYAQYLCFIDPKSKGLLFIQFINKVFFIFVDMRGAIIYAIKLLNKNKIINMSPKCKGLWDDLYTLPFIVF